MANYNMVRTQINYETEVWEAACLHWMNTLHGFGRRSIHAFLQRFGTAAAVWEATEAQLKQVDGRIGGFVSDARKGRDPKADYRHVLEKDIRLVPYGSQAFPRRLKNIPDPPTGLYVAGKLPPDSDPSCAVIGTRRCTAYGRSQAEMFAARLAEERIPVVSGMAMGIDSIAQAEAIRRGGDTYGVLGGGIDVIYPKEHWNLYEKVKEHGGLISEYPPGTKPIQGYFPQRNRIISGLSDVILVVEAKRKSGTLITVDQALEQGREVYAVPGRINDPQSEGCNELIRQGAHPALSADILLEAFGRTGGELKDRIAREGDTAHNAVFACLDYMPQTAGQIHERLMGQFTDQHMTLPNVTTILFDLVLQGVCGQDGSYFYRR